MYLTSLALTDFRSYSHLELDLFPGVNLFLGSNGYGKTNLIEAIEYVASLSSHRVATDPPLIRAGQSAATISVKLMAGRGDARSLSLDVTIRAVGANQARLAGAPARPRALLGAVRVVRFAPEDLVIVRGDPGDRRRWIDDVVVTRWPRLAGVKADYDRVLRQKTALLKAMSGRGPRRAGAGAEETLDVWDDQLARLGAELMMARDRTVGDLLAAVTAHYGAIAPTPAEAVIAYQAGVQAEPETETTLAQADDLAEVLRQAMARRRRDEIDRGLCLVGPHRDDLALSLQGLPVKGYASHGETWSFVLALRLASLELLQADGLDPILLLDDVFAELDEHRRQRLVTATTTVEQTFITAAVAGDIPANLSATVYRVTPGQVSQGGRSARAGDDDGD